MELSGGVLEVSLAVLKPSRFSSAPIVVEAVSNCFGSVWEPSTSPFGFLGGLWGPSQAVLGRLGAILGCHGPILGSSWAVLDAPWAVLERSEPSWGHLGPSWRDLEAFELVLGALEPSMQISRGNFAFFVCWGPFGGPLGAFWSRLGGFLGSLEAIVGRLGAIWGRVESTLGVLELLGAISKQSEAVLVHFWEAWGSQPLWFPSLQTGAARLPEEGLGEGQQSYTPCRPRGVGGSPGTSPTPGDLERAVGFA
eukprot:9481013-Pyramimonas_sp.AAC.1